jgi:hypothetical protein
MTQPALFQTAAPIEPWMTSLPTWLAQNLDAYQPAPRSHYAELTYCRRCTAIILRGASGPHHPQIPYRADPTQLSNNEEVAATLLRRPTIHLNRTAHGIDGHQRLEWDIASLPASTHLVVPTHQCHKPLGSPITWELLYTPPKENNHDTPAPF